MENEEEHKTPIMVDNSFQREVIENRHPVLIQFSAEWCGPCKMLTPIIDELHRDYKVENKSIKIYKMDIDNNLDTPSKLGIRAIPTMVLFKNGQVVATKSGVHPKKNISDWIDSTLKVTN